MGLMPDKDLTKQTQLKYEFENFPAPPPVIPIHSPVLKLSTEVSLLNAVSDPSPTASHISGEVQSKHAADSKGKTYNSFHR